MPSSATIDTRVGIFGGTFDPVHRAHLALARLFLEHLALDELRFVPAGDPWQKEGVSASRGERLAMLQLAITGATSRLSIDSRELEREGVSYTVDTLQQLRAELGAQAMLVLLIGADQLERLHTWSRWTEIFQLANLAIAARTGFSWDESRLAPEVYREIVARQRIASPRAGSLGAASGEIALVPANVGPTSSSFVRECLRRGNYEALRDLVPSEVIDYIRTHHLYRD